MVKTDQGTYHVTLGKNPNNESRGFFGIQANKHFDVVLPGYTHMQHAQPIFLSHHLLAYVWMLGRDFKRLAAARDAADVNPLGSAALAGTTYPLDRHTLTPDTTLGVSNEVAAGASYAEVTHEQGHLLVILSID